MCYTAVLLAVLSPCSFNRKEIVNVNFVINMFVTNLCISFGHSDLIYPIYGDNPPWQ